MLQCLILNTVFGHTFFCNVFVQSVSRKLRYVTGFSWFSIGYIIVQGVYAGIFVEALEYLTKHVFLVNVTLLGVIVFFPETIANEFSFRLSDPTNWSSKSYHDRNKFLRHNSLRKFLFFFTFQITIAASFKNTIMDFVRVKCIEKNKIIFLSLGTELSGASYCRCVAIAWFVYVRSLAL